MANFVTIATNFLVGRVGVNIQDAMVLSVRGRKSGEPRSLVVNPLELDGSLYLLSPRGETQWVKNIRASSAATLKRGRSETSYKAIEVTDTAEKFGVIRAYLDRWSWQVNNLMGVSKGSTDKELEAILDKHPIFVLSRS